MRYETRKPSELSPYSDNARTHTPEQIEKMSLTGKLAILESTGDSFESMKLRP